MDPPDKHRDPRSFGPATAAFVVVSSMIGGGVLTTSGFTLVAVKGHAAMLTLWAVGGLVALCGALTLAELSAALPRSGGEYAILAEAYGPGPALLAGWVSLVLGFAAPIAATASAAADYLLTPLALGEDRARLAGRVVGSLAIVAFATVHATGRGPAARMQVGITAAKVVALSLFLVAGLAAGWGRWSHLLDRGDLPPPTAAGLLFSLVYVSYAYTGWNGAAYIGGEIGDPRRLPRAILMGTGLVIGLYLGLNLVYALAIPAPELVALADRGGPEAVEKIAQLAAERLFGPAWGARLAVVFGLVLLGSLSALILTGPRVALAMARAGQFPAVAARLSGRGRTPAVATGVLAAGGLAMLWAGGFESLIVYAGVGLAIFSLLTVASVFVLRRLRPDLPRPFLVPLYPLVPAFYLLMTTVLIIAAFVERPRESALALASILAGLPIHFAGRSLRARLTRRPVSPEDW